MSDNNLPVKNNLRPLPKLIDLHKEPMEAFKHDEYKLLLNQPPHEKWIKRNKFANDAQYLPIDKTEFLLDYIYTEWWPEVLCVQQIFNAVQVTVRVHYVHPVTGTERFVDGVGAEEVQTKAGASASDFSQITNKAVAKAVPIAKSEAIKDATHHLGEIFGRNLNRRDSVPYSSAYARPEETEPEAPPAETKKPETQPEAPQPQPASDPNDLPLF